MTVTTTLKLDESIKDRVGRLAASRQRALADLKRPLRENPFL